MSGRTILALSLFAAMSLPAAAQQSVSPQAAPVAAQTPAAINMAPANTVERSIVAVDYRNKGTTDVDFRGTALMPRADGHAKVKSHSGRMELDTHFHHLQAARTFGPEYLTYVLWAITPEGRATNLGEVMPNDDGDADVLLTTPLQDFGLILTAEPYFAVSQPGEMVVAENVVRPDTKGIVHPATAKFRALRRGQYTVNLSPAQLPATSADMKKTPLELLQAQNAVAIAQAFGADQYAPDALQRARGLLTQAQDSYNQKLDKSRIAPAARAAAQAAEDARLLSVQNQHQAQLAAQQQAAQQSLESARAQAEAEQTRAEQARAQAEKESAQRALAEQQNQTAEAARQQAEQARVQAQQEAQAAAEQRQQAEQQALTAQQQAQQATQQQQQAQQQLQQAEAQRQSAAQQAEQARLQAQRAEQEKTQAQQQAEQSRQQLTQQLNQIMQTRETAQGVIMTMPDVLFDTGKATLKPGAKLRLAKVAGIILGYPQLHIDVDGFTDSTGSVQFNQALSDERAAAVRDFLVSQGVPVNNIVARGFGPSRPVATNATPEGRQQNRRVELVVTGNAIAATTTTTTPAAGGVSGSATTAAPAGGVAGAATTTTPTTSTPQPSQPAVASPQPNPTVPPRIPPR